MIYFDSDYMTGEHESAVRFVTDWATTEADIDTLLAAL